MWTVTGSPYIFTGNVTVLVGQTLTIQPGCQVIIPASRLFTIRGTLIANGSVSDSIRFTGQSQSGNPYGGNINFVSTSINSVISYLSADSLGQVRALNYFIRVSGTLSISNSSIRNAGSYAIQIERNNVSINNFSFSSQNQSYYSIYLSTDTVSPTIQNCTFNGSIYARSVYISPGGLSSVSNNSNAIILLQGNVTQNSAWPNPGPGSSYKVQYVYVNNGKTLTIQPGSRVNVPFNTTFIIAGSLIANGTSTDSIYFTGGRSNPSYQYGGNIDFTSTSANSSLP